MPNWLTPFKKRQQLIVPAVRSTSSLRRTMADTFLLLLIIADRSPSTYWASNAYQQIAKSFERIFNTLRKKEPLILQQLEVAILGFSARQTTKLYTPFTPAAQLEEFPEVPEVPTTHIYESVCHGVAEIKTRMEYLAKDEDRQPQAVFMFNMSDFNILPPDDAYKDAAIEATQVAAEYGISIFNFLCGDTCDERVATELCQPGIPPLPTNTADFEELFADWVVQSMRAESMSQFGQSTQLTPFNGIVPTTRLIRD